MPAAKQLEFGGHALVWVGDWSAASARSAISSAARNGYDYIELAIFDPWSFDIAMTKDLLQEFNLRAHASLGLSAKTDVTSPDASIVKKGDELLCKVADVLHALGGTELCGVIYSSLAKYPGPASKEARASSVAAMQRLADYTAELGINIDLEVVNRYETNIMNTGLEGLEFLDQVNRPNAFIHLDTYHMNIEEKGAGNGIIAAREHLRYIHLSESDRGTPGAGTCDWDEIFATLKAIGFRGGLAMESFINMPPELAYGLAVWRPVAESREEVIGQGLPFLRNKARQYGLIDA